MRPHISGKRVICGHTPQPDGRIGLYQWGQCLDTDCCRGAWLTCLDVASGEYWQANEGGGTRGGNLNQA
jgi:serine/threonine protein phosphatase 1